VSVTPNAAARTILGLAGLLFALGGVLEVAQLPQLLTSPADPQIADYVRAEGRMAVFLGAVSIAIGAVLFHRRARIAERIEPATEGDALRSAPLQALAYRLLGFYYLVPALGSFVIYAYVAITSAGSDWFVWLSPFVQAVVAGALILAAGKLAHAWPA
jgi:hypothetical protein